MGQICLYALVVDLDLGEFVDLVLKTLERGVWVIISKWKVILMVSLGENQ